VRRHPLPSYPATSGELASSLLPSPGASILPRRAEMIQLLTLLLSLRDHPSPCGQQRSEPGALFGQLINFALALSVGHVLGQFTPFTLTLRL
jgi:hypothetical protein